MAGRSDAQIAEMVRDMKVPQKGKKNVLLERLDGKKTAFTEAVTRAARQMALDISKGTLLVPTTVREVAPFASALTALTKTKVPPQHLLAALRVCRDLANRADDGNALGLVFKAAYRVDEMFFAEVSIRE